MNNSMALALVEYETLPRDVQTIAAVLIRVPPSVARWLGNDARGSLRRPSWTVRHLANYFGKSEEAAAQAIDFAQRHNLIEPAQQCDHWQFRQQPERMGGAAWN